MVCTHIDDGGSLDGSDSVSSVSGRSAHSELKGFSNEWD
jgi:hypothetical protein